MVFFTAIFISFYSNTSPFKVYANIMKKLKKYLSIITYLLFSFKTKKGILIFVGSPSDSFGNMQLIYQQCLDENIPVENIYMQPSFCKTLLNIISLAGAKILFTDVATPYPYLPIRKETQVIQCWHAGGAYKHMGFDAKIPGKNENTEELRIARNVKNISYFMTSSPFVSDICSTAFKLSTDQIKCLGVPRTDILHTLPKRKADMSRFCILYAPTYRTHKKERIVPNLLDFKLLQKELGDTFTLAYRSHPTSPCTIPEGSVNFSNKPYIQALAEADMLITDYSSIFFDFLYFNRPILFFIPDYTDYIAHDKKLYFHPADLFADTTCYQIDELISKIKKYLTEPVDYTDIWGRYMSACDGQSTKKIIHFTKQLLQ